MKKQSEIIQGTEKEFINLFQKQCTSRNPWEVWQDIITAIACGISNAADRSEDHYEKREKEYVECARRLGGDEKVAEFLNVIVTALDRDSEQDFLGKMFMDLELGNHWKGQFFTPYSVCRLMAGITLKGAEDRIASEGYISICDPACGAGATLIAAANQLLVGGCNYQQHVIFAGQDIDRTVALMCFIQLSLLGCPGYIVIGDTLADPMVGHVLFPQETESQELWITPMFFSEAWTYRRLFHSIGGDRVKNKDHYIYFDFYEEEEHGRETA